MLDTFYLKVSNNRLHSCISIAASLLLRSLEVFKVLVSEDSFKEFVLDDSSNIATLYCWACVGDLGYAIFLEV